MKKRTVNEHVIKAISIGLSAMMAMSPVTAMAEEIGEQPDGSNEPIEANQKEETAQDIADAATKTAGEIQEDAKAAKLVADDVNAVEEDGAELDKAGTALDKSQKTVTDDAENVKKDLADAKNEANAIDNSLDQADTVVDAAVEAAEKAASDIAAKKDVYDKQVAEISSAKTTEEAKSAYDKAQATAEEAQAAYDAAVDEYNKNKTAYDEAVAKVAEAQKAYDAAVAKAAGDAAEAEKALEQAKADAEALKTAADQSAKEAAESAAYKIAELERKAQSHKDIDWNEQDKLFIAIMNNYYLPQQDNVKEVISNVVTKYADDSKNFFTVKYKDNNGEEQTAYYNYKLDEKKNLVIFEKTFEDVLVTPGEEAQYVINDAEGNTEYSCPESELQNKLDSGEIINVGSDEKPVYAKVNADGTTTTLVTAGETKKGNVTTNVEVDNTKVDYVYDAETDTYTKVEKGDVTTTKTYSGVSLSSDKKYATKAEAEAAAKADAAAEAEKLANGEKVTDVATDVKISEEKTTTYTGSATYISAFTATIDMGGIKENSWSKASDVAKNIKKDAIKDAEDELWDNGYYLLDSNGNVQVNKTKDNKIWADEYTTTADSSITLTYAKYETQEVKYTLWDDIKDIFQGDKNKDKAAKAIKQKIEEQGGLFIDIKEFNWDLGTATCYVIPSQSVTATDEQKTASAASTAAQKAAEEAAKKESVSNSVLQKVSKEVTGSKNKVKTNEAVATSIKTSTKSETETSYKYSGTYTATTVTVADGVEISKVSGYATELAYKDKVDPVYDKNCPTNANYLAGNILLNEKTDEGLRNYIETAKKKKADYDRIVEEAKAADDAVADAQKKVDTLKNQIELLEKKKTTTAAKLADLEAQLSKAEAKLKDAKDTADTLKDAEKTYKDKVAALTPPGGNGGNGGNTDNGGNGGNTDNGGNGGNTDNGGNGGNTNNGGNGGNTNNGGNGGNTNNGGNGGNTNNGGNGGNTNNGGNGGNTNNGGNGGNANNAGATTTATATTTTNARVNVAAADTTVDIEEEDVPLADGALDEDADVKENEDTNEATTIDDEEVAKSAMAEDETQKKMSWWWLLIVAVFGVAGEEMYRRHLNKKKNVEVVSRKDEK